MQGLLSDTFIFFAFDLDILRRGWISIEIKIDRYFPRRDLISINQQLTPYEESFCMLIISIEINSLREK